MTFGIVSHLLLMTPWILYAAADKAAHPEKELPLPGEVFVIEGRTAFLIPATTGPAAESKPWVWYAPTLPDLPSESERWMFERFLKAGIAIAGIDAGESYGSPTGNKLFTALYDEMTKTRGYSAKPVFLGRSRGGLMALSWSAANPDKVGAFAGIYPVCNFASYPGIKNAASAYEMSPEALQAKLTDYNPVDRLANLAKARVPLFAIHGDVDKVVPLEANSGLMKERYVALGGTMELIVPPQQGHNMWPGFFQCTELVDFVKANAGIGIVLDTPIDFQVIQQTAMRAGTIRINGRLNESEAKPDAMEYRLTIIEKAKENEEEWHRLDAMIAGNQFQVAVEAPAGGWYRLEVRTVASGAVIAESVVEHVGVGEVFVVAGQSNSANYGEEKQTTQTERVATFDGRRWQLAHDPQPGASGEGGSFLPPLGDALSEKFGVPVGFVSCGVGGSSVREWLPKGATFPNPPTIESHVTKTQDGMWESRGDLFVNLCERMNQFGPHGFRAVLWHQGESDANQKDPTRTLPGKLYREYLEKVIRDSRREIGWDAPWFVAQVSYHVPGDESSPDIRAAQASTWKDGIAFEGPDSDALKGSLRDGDGKGVHFSGPGLREHAARWVDKIFPWLEQQSK